MQEDAPAKTRFYVYVLHSKSSDKIYIGYSADQPDRPSAEEF
jgi:predicted GIY-YIG superfamily endonuclease